LLVRTPPDGPRRSAGWAASQARSSCASPSSRSRRASVLGGQVGLDRARVLGPVPGEHRGRGRLALRRLPFEVGPHPAPALGRIARKLHAVDGEHLAPDQALLVTDGEHRGEHVRDVGAEGAHELRDGREVRGGVPAERDEGHVLAAEPLDGPAAHDPVRIRTQHDREQHRGRVRRRPGVVVAEARVEARQVDRVGQEVVRRVLEGAGQELPGQVDGQKARAPVDMLVAGHRRDAQGRVARPQRDSANLALRCA